MSFFCHHLNKAIFLSFIPVVVLVSLFGMYLEVSLQNYPGQTSTISSNIASNNITSTISSNVTSSEICITPAQPLGMYLRILSDDSDSPVSGANVTATHEFENLPCGGVSSPSQLLTTTTKFLTNGVEWYSLDTINDGKYILNISFSGKNFDFTAELRPVVITCATLYVPSGISNVTIGPGPCQ
jgi:hypothetical protein